MLAFDDDMGGYNDLSVNDLEGTISTGKIRCSGHRTRTPLPFPWCSCSSFVAQLETLNSASQVSDAGPLLHLRAQCVLL